MKIDLFTGGCYDIGGNKNPRKKYYSIEEDMGVYICNYLWDPMASIYSNFENWLALVAWIIFRHECAKYYQQGI